MQEPSHVRLPPVHVPREDQLQPSPAFSNMRRPSLSDPFLHAYTPSQAQESMPAAGEYATGARRGSPHEGVPPHGSTATKGELSRPGSPTDGGGGRYPGPGAAYDYNSSSYNGQHHPSGFAQPAPQSNYRFGGPPPLPNSSQDATSYFDYSMRRHSLTTTNNSHPPNPNSPSRLNAADAHPTPPPTSGVKRKPSAEDTILEDSQQGYPYPPPTSNAHLAQGAYAKRRGSSLTYDKLGNLSLSDQARRDSGMSSGGLSPWEDDRRGSNGSWTSVGSQGYAMSSYAMPSDPYDQRGQHPPQAMSGYGSPHSRQPSDHQQQQQPPFFDPSRTSMAPPASQHESQMSYGRRPSIGIDQLVQGPNVGYGAPPMPSHQSQPYPRGLTQPAGMLPSVAHSPPDDHDPRPHSSSSSVHHGPPPSSSYPGHGPPPGTWARANSLPSNSLVNHPPPQVPRHASTGSLDPNIAYGPGGVLKDSPYSRSPELRVTHKLAERKRRKEMAQLFDDLKDSLPVDRGLKSSKWEILSKSIEFIAQLKAHNQELLNDNNMLRDHFGLGPGPVAPSGSFEGPPTAHHGYEASNQPPSESSHSQSSQAGPPHSYGPPPPHPQQQHQDQWQHSAPPPQSQPAPPPPPLHQQHPQQMHHQSSAPQERSPTASQIKEGSPVIASAPASAPTRRSPRMSRSTSKNGSGMGDGGESEQGMEE